MENPACDAPLHKWSGDLTQHLIKGGGGGRFSYNPKGDVVSLVEGEYDFVTGDFSYSERFHPDHWRKSTYTEGYGYARRNGDLDVAYSYVTEDVLGAVSQVSVRLERVGCEVVKITQSDELEFSLHGNYSVDGLEYTEEVVGDDWAQVSEGIFRPDGTYSEAVTVSGSGWVQSSTLEGDADGFSHEDWTYQEGSSEAEGFTERFLDGSSHQEYTFTTGQSFSYSMDYAGNGTGTYEDADMTCDLTYTEGVCVADCSDGNRYDC